MKISYDTIKGSLTKLIPSLYQDHLIGLSLYGYQIEDIKKGAPVPLNVLVILKDIPPTLTLSQKKLMKKFKHPIQWTFFTEEEIDNALDVFPLEFIEIQHTQDLLYGKDVLKNKTIEHRHLRHECEFILRSTLLKIRESLAKGTPKHILILDSLPIIYSVLRCLLVLKASDIPSTKQAVIQQLSTHIHINTDLFDMLYLHLDSKRLEDYFTPYVSELTLIIRHINAL